MDSDGTALLRCESISKRFKGVQALQDVDFSIYPGHVHGLVGANGAGKSTLMKIISGAYALDQGRLAFGGKPISIRSTQDALDHGIVTIYQDINLVENMTIAENIFLNNEPSYGFTRLIKRKEMYQRVTQLLREYNIQADPDDPVGTLPNDTKKMIQAIKAVSQKAKILLMDEPTSSLTRQEEKRVLHLIRALAAKSVGIVFISHYLSEIFEVCDSITVMRDGRVVETLQTKNTTIDQVVKHMLGREIEETLPSKQSFITDQEILSVKNLNVKRKLKDISFQVKKGEVLGITGLMGAGSAELAKAIFGSTDIKKQSGEILIHDRAVKINHPQHAVANGIALVTNDRINEGLLARKALYENICLATLPRFRNRLRLLSKPKMIEKSRQYVQMLDIKTPGVMTSAESLSGGNQQKVLLAKWLETQPSLFIMNEPTIGIDVGTKHEIRKLVKNISARGISILLITAEPEEIEKLCDRVLVMFRGRIVKELKENEINKKNILKASTSGE